MKFIDEHLLIAVVAAMLNIIFSLVLPVIFKGNELPYSDQIRKNYNTNRSVIILSSILVIIFVYTSLKVTPLLNKSIYKKLANLS
jgi:hypothetical protein